MNEKLNSYNNIVGCLLVSFVKSNKITIATQWAKTTKKQSVGVYVLII